MQQEKAEMERRKKLLKNRKSTNAGGKMGVMSMDISTMMSDKMGKSTNLNPHISNNFYVQNTGVDVGGFEVVGNSLESIKDAKDRINSRMQILTRVINLYWISQTHCLNRKSRFLKTSLKG